MRDPHAQEALRDLDRAFRNFSQARKNGHRVGFPRFKRKGVRDSCRFSTGAIKALGSFVQLPRLGKIRVKESTDRLRGRILSATLSREADRWYVSFTVERERTDPEGVEGPAVGIDVGVDHFATLSTGERLESPRPLKKRLRRLKRLSKRHSRKQKGSMKRRKSAMCLARLHRRIRNCRLDFLRKTTTHLARTKRVIVIEDLAVKNLTKSARGTKSKPGSRVRQKSGLNRSILDQGWGVFRRMLEYKTTWYGSVLIVAPRFHASSKTCSACGEVLTDGLPLSVRQWTCPNCAAEHDRDLNAAINLERITTESSSGSHARRDSSDGGTDTSPVYESRVVEAGSERWISAAGP